MSYCTQRFMSLKLIVLFIILHASYYIEGWIADLESFSQEYNPDIVKFMNFRLVNYTNNYKLLNGSVTYKQDLDKFDVKFNLSIPKGNGQPWTILNVTINGCDYLEKSWENNRKFPYFFLAQLRETNLDFPKMCPIEKDKEIPIRNFSFHSEKIFSNFPRTPFSCICILRRHRVQAFKLFFNGTIRN